MSVVTFTCRDNSTRVLESGCYIDGHNGQYVYRMLADLYDGLVGSAESEQTMQDMRDAYQIDDLETILYIADDILDDLNPRCHDGMFNWHDGELFLNTWAELDNEGDVF